MARNAKNNPVFKHNAKTEEWRRPSHRDFMTAEELKKDKFTGLRNNQLGLCTEIWVLGEMRAAVSFADGLSKVEDKYKEIFGFHMDTKLIGPTTNPSDRRRR